MIVKCPQCKTQYRYDTARFGEADSKKLKCPKCQHVFEIYRPSDSDPVDVTAMPRALGDGEPNEQTEQVVAPDGTDLPQLAPLPRTMRFSLAVIAGPQAGSVFQIAKPRIYLGRGTEVEVQLKDAEVSRKHACIEIRDEIATLIDLGSTNGSYAAGERINRWELENQSEFTVGATTMMFLVTEAD